MFDVPQWPSDDEGVVPKPSQTFTKPLEKKKKKNKKDKLQKSPGTNGSEPKHVEWGSGKGKLENKKVANDESKPFESLTKKKKKKKDKLENVTGTNGSTPTLMELGSEKRKLGNSESTNVSKRKKLSSSDPTTKSIEQEVGGLLRRGIRFSSECELNEFAEIKKKKKKSKKSKDVRVEAKDSKTFSHEIVTLEKKKKKSKKKKDVESGTFTICKAIVANQVDSRKPKEIQFSEDSITETKASPVFSAAKNKLKSSQFRYINEKLYRQRGAQSLKMFSSDKDSFKIYHEGYAEQLRKWPKDPLNIIIPAILKQKPSDKVIADFGCGEARLAKSVSGNCKQIHSFDFVALNNFVTVCDMAATPLSPRSVDIAVFCLSLMGLNLRDYLKEANRVLKIGGELKIAEVESRFLETPVDDFIKILEKFGFKLNSKDLSHKFFYLMDFTKVHDCGKKVPEFSLKPCVYKKR